ncbi:uncharacterized protein LOC142982818, partial [Anticarsia gemmatalis]|uniref:uncharacterized protein LOC142982818 n=1 Tax=Anticarsia gemmatalis TaxID=129554 RepID=UPI003F7730B9
ILERLKDLVLFTTLDTLFHALLYVQSFIEVAHSQNLTNDFSEVFPLIRFFAIIWVIKNIVLIRKFSISCDQLYNTVNDVDADCCQLLGINQDLTGSKRLCKQVLHMNRGSFSKMTACRVFTIDASLSKNLGGLVCSYTIVLLQFTA